MNIAFFLTPKKDIVYQKTSSTMRQALERMEYHRYTAIPVLDDNEMYVGTLTEGDLLWKIKNTPGLTFSNVSKVKLSQVPMHTVNKPVHIDCRMEDLIFAAINQNFVPVVDDENRFIGIITRKSIMNYCYEMLYKKEKIEA